MARGDYKSLTGAEVHPKNCDHPEFEVVETVVGEFRRCARCRQLQDERRPRSLRTRSPSWA